MRLLWPCLISALIATQLRAETYIFKWVDRQGNVHVTDRLGEVPQPYRSLYAAEVKRREAAVEGGSAPAAPASSVADTPEPSVETESHSARIGRDRARWKKLVAAWRARLKSSTEALDGLDARIAQARANPLLRHTPQVKERVATLMNERTRLLANVEKARSTLLHEIPAKARKERVPPKWLE